MPPRIITIIIKKLELRKLTKYSLANHYFITFRQTTKDQQQKYKNN